MNKRDILLFIGAGILIITFMINFPILFWASLASIVGGLILGHR